MNAQNNPLISIITPSYNQGCFIEETILSVKNQDYPNIEHIIVDGGSTDKTVEILENYEGTYNMRWISEKDNGQSDAINKGFAIANGQIVGWLNSDDLYFYKNSISTVVCAFNTLPDVEIIYGHAAKINHENRLLRVKVVPEFNYSRLKKHNFIIQPSCFWKSKVCKENKLQTSMDCSFDYEYWLRLGKKYKWHRIKRILSADRNHPDRKIIANLKKSIAETEALRKKMNVKNNLFSVIRKKTVLALERVKGLVYIIRVTNQRHNSFAFEIKKDKLLLMIKTQLIKKDRELL